jgi:hypothetical protein
LHDHERTAVDADHSSGVAVSAGAWGKRQVCGSVA